jgi:hypothetical protein
MNNGSPRKWIEGRDQSIFWADSVVRLLRKDGDEWEEVKELESSMKGVLPRDWALEFSGGKVQES